MLLNIIENSEKNIIFYSIESDLLCFKAAKKNLKNNLEDVNLILGRVHEVDDLDYVNKNIIIDYGYLESRMKDTLMAIRKHKISEVLEEFGNSDITYKLNFELLKKITNILKLKCQGVTTQRNFLTNLGIQERAEILSRNLPFSKKADIYYRLKRLIDKNQMGDLFKVMLITDKKINFKTGFEID